MVFLTRKEQQIAEACKNLIKNAVIFWNYLYLTRKIQRTKDPEKVAELLELLKSKTANTWRHIYFNGSYDFSAKNLIDTYNLLFSDDYSINID